MVSYIKGEMQANSKVGCNYKHSFVPLINKEGRLKAGNSCCYSVQTLSSSRLLSKNLKIKIPRYIRQ